MNASRRVVAALLLSAASGAARAQVCDPGPIPELAVCGAIAATSELGALQKVSCLLSALNRWRMQVIACTQQRVDAWQAAVIWPIEGLRSIRVALRRVRTLRDEVEGLADSGWHLDPAQQALADSFTSPRRVEREIYESAWGRSVGAGSDVQDLIAWHSALSRNAVQGRTNGEFGVSGELPESTWERIGREAAATVGDDQRDALSAIRMTPQLIADRLRVEGSTARMLAHAVVTSQLRRDFRRLRREREQHLGALMLGTLTESSPRAGGE